VIKRRAISLIYLVLVLVFAVLLAPKLMQVQSLSDRCKNNEIKLRRMRQENQRLEMELKALREDPVYLEKVSREKFNKAKPGEIVYKVVKQSDTVAAN
jgi:cell division protein FtsB